VLRELQARGLTLLFTDEVVRPEMRVLREPVEADARRLLDEVLAPHGLEAREGPAGVLVIAVARTPAAEHASIRGEVFVLGSRRGGLSGARVRSIESGREGLVEDDGAFAIESLPAGRHTLEASAEGYLSQRAEVVVEAGRARPVVFHLHPLPFVAEEIVVRPSRTTLLHERPDSSFSLSRDEIDRLPHLGGDLFRATSLLPGTAANDVSAQFSVHGGRRDEVKVLLDGQELYEAYHLKDYDNALSIVPERALAGASLSTGAYAASQGDRMSGVLDLRTADPVRGRRHVVSASVLDVTASTAGSVAGGRGGWLVSGRRGSIDLASEFLGDEDPSFWDVLGKVDAETPAGRLTGRVLVATDELEVNKADEGTFERLENDYRSRYLWLTHQATPGDVLLVETTASSAAVERDRGGAASEEEGSFAMRDQRDLEVAGLVQSWSIERGGRHHPSWGWELRRYDAAFDYEKELDPDLVILAPFSGPRLFAHAFDGTLRADDTSAWASDRLALERLTAEVGLRWDRHQATGDELWSPRVNLAWRLDDRSVLRAAWGRFHQSQRPYELQVEDGDRALFRAERSEHTVLGYEAILARRRAGLEAIRFELFRRDVDRPRPRYENLLEPLNFLPEIEPDRVRIAPLGGSAEGVELLLRGRAGDRLETWLAYSYARTRERFDFGSVPRSLDQPHTGAIGMDWRLGRNWSVDLAWRYRTGWPTTPVEALLLGGVPEEAGERPELAAVFGPLRSERLPVYHRLDARASRRFDLRRGTLTLFLDVQNLYDRENRAGFDVELDDEGAAVRTEDEDWPGIFPSLGVAWEF
jgi:outer membrane receptor protein involved in Fe transport